MKKLSILVLICLLLSLTMMACAGEGTETTQSADGTTGEQTGDTSGEVTSGEPHEHAYGDAWLSNADGHYHVCECGEKSDAAAHTVDVLGNCSVCGYEDSVPAMDTLANAMAIASLTQGNVKFGTLETVYGSNDVEYPYRESSFAWYETADNYLHVRDLTNQVHYYATLLADDEVFYLVKVGEDMYVDQDATALYMGGPAVDLSNVGIQEEHYGVISLIDRLYNLDDLLEVTDPTENVEDGLYTFSRTYNAPSLYGGEATTVVVTVEFTFAPDTYIIDKADFYFNNSDDSYYEYHFEQSIPANNYNPEIVLPTSFVINNPAGEAIVFAEGVAESINVTIGESIFTFTDPVPATGLLALLDVKVEFIDADGTAVEFVNGAYATYYNGELSFVASEPGTYTVKLTVFDATYTIPVVAAYKTPTEIVANEYVDSDMGMPVYTPTTGITVYTGISSVICGLLEEGCDPAYTATLIGANAGDATLVERNDLGWDQNGKGYTFTSNVAGTYTVELVSAANADVKTTVTVTVKEVPPVAEVAQGKYTDVSGGVLNFYPEENAAIATFTLPRAGNVTAVFYYSIEDNVFTAVADANYTDATLRIVGDKVLLSTNGMTAVSLTFVKKGNTPDAMPGDITLNPPVEGEATNIQNGKEFTENDAAGGTYSVEIEANGTVAFPVMFGGEKTDPGFVVTVTWENTDVTAKINTSDLVNGGTFGCNFDDWNQQVSFVNNSAEPITLVFTFTWANA